MVIRNWCHKSVTTATLLAVHWPLYQEDFVENILGLSRPGHYNEVAFLMRWTLSEFSLYDRDSESTCYLLSSLS